MLVLKKRNLLLAASIAVLLMFSLSACGSKKKVEINTTKDLEGLTVGCQVSTTADDSLKELAKTVNFTTKKYDQIVQTFADLKAGRLDAIVVDEVVARDYVKKHSEDYKITGEKLTNEPIGICFKKGNEKIRDKFNVIIDEFQKDGTLKKISEKWFADDLTGNIANVGITDAQGTSDNGFQFPVDKKKLVVGVDNTYPPMEYMDGSNTVGFDVDFAAEIAKKLNMEVQLAPTAWDGIFAALNTEKFDCIISSVSINEDRLKNFAITKPYIANAQVIVVRAK